MTVIERINANKADGAIKMGLTVFTSGMKPVFDDSATLNEGDILIFPTLEEMKDRIGSRTFNGNDYEFMVIDVEAPDGTKRAINWFPTTFQNPLFVWAEDSDKKPYRTSDVLYPEGTAVAEFLKVRGQSDFDTNGNILKSDTQKGVELLAGKKVKVSSKVLYKTTGFKKGVQDTSTLIDKALFKYDLVA